MVTSLKQEFCKPRRLSHLQIAPIVGMVAHVGLAHADAVLDEVGLVAVELVVKGLMLLLSFQLLLRELIAAASISKLWSDLLALISDMAIVLRLSICCEKRQAFNAFIKHLRVRDLEQA